ncbi:MAG: hypothetical protein JW751_16990 [Polyangiaceae bacterium]|nr:hypothetical protein [Polyangiaceae bacterium]
MGRRRLLGVATMVTVAGSPLVYLLGEGLAQLAHAESRSRRRLRERLVSLLRSGDKARQIGRMYLWSRSPPPTLDELISNVVPTIDQDAALTSERWELRQYVRDAVEADYEEVYLVPIGGWLLSETEAELCALTVEPAAP